MLKNIFISYFSDKNYALLYAQNALKTAAVLTMGLFIGGWLYKIGLDLHWIILYHAANFTLMGLLSPLGSYMAGRYGLSITYGCSFLAHFLSLLCLSFAADHMILILPGLLFSALGNGLQNPPDMMLPAVYTQDENRGRAFSVLNCTSALMTLAAILGSGWLADHFGLFGVSLLCAFFWCLSLLCLSKMDDHLRGQERVDVKQTYVDVFALKNRRILALSLGFNFIVIGSFVLVPIVLYISTQSFQDISIVAAIAIGVQMLILIMQGIWVDKTSSYEPLNFAISIHSLGLLIYAFFAFGKLGLFFADTLQRTGLLLFFGAIFPRIHAYILRRQDPVLSFGATWHMAICFWEFITLNIMALIVFIFGAAALPYCLLICAVGSFAGYLYCKKLA